MRQRRNLGLDDCVFYAKNPLSNEIAILWVYVDDSGLTGNWDTEITMMKRASYSRIVE